MELEVGSILTGKVTGITKFGAFVSLTAGKSGLVHISEIANSYVSDVNEFLKEGQEVKVKIIGIDDNGRINLSIKKAIETPPQENIAQPKRPARPYQPKPQQTFAPAPVKEQPKEMSFEDKLKQFMQDSDSKISGLYADRKTNRRRGR